MRPYILAETNWKNLKDATIELAVLPWGATEAHNYHLPYGTDNYQAESITAASAKKTWEAGGKIMVLPCVPFGVNTGQSDIFLDMNLNPSTQLAILDDLITVLNRQGVKKLLIFNGHGGNNFKPLVRELGLRFPEMFISFCFFPQIIDKTLFFDAPGDHADEMETSLMLHIKPELVLARETWGDGASKKHKINAFNEGWAWAERKWSAISADTGVGNPHKATADKGEKFHDAIATKLGAFMLELCKADSKDLYE